MGADKLDIWNRALARISAVLVNDIAEQSLSARESRRFYTEIVDNMLEGPNEWSFGKQRVTLATAASNDRPQEWLYAYVLPSNMRTPVRVIPDLTAAGIAIPLPLPGNPYAETWATFLNDIAAPYVIDGGVLYCNEPNAILEFVIDDLTGLTVPAMVTKAMSTELASLLAVPLKKDKGLSNALAQEADLYWQRAIADDRNRQPEQWGTYTSESLLARHTDI